MSVMTRTTFQHSAFRVPHSRAGFTLVELLTVVFIVSLLIGILIPSLSAARSAAKKAVTRKAMESISVGLEMFKNDNGADFVQTNGYPPSFAHPPIPGVDFKPHTGEFPFLSGYPKVYGAEWLPAMLIGFDTLGYIQRSNVPASLRPTPEDWYTPDPRNDGSGILERAPMYVDPGNVNLIRTADLPGRPNTDTFFPNFSDGNPPYSQRLRVIGDGFDYPILYYVASKHGRPTNMLEEHRSNINEYTGGTQEEGVPYYFHEDNEGFTGTTDDPSQAGERGWDFNGVHPIGRSGADLSAADLLLEENRGTFARYIVDRKLFRTYEDRTTLDPNAALRPVNPDSYLLISPGPDGQYGTSDDVSNLPPWPE